MPLLKVVLTINSMMDNQHNLSVITTCQKEFQGWKHGTIISKVGAFRSSEYNCFFRLSWNVKTYLHKIILNILKFCWDLSYLRLGMKKDFNCMRTTILWKTRSVNLKHREKSVKETKQLLAFVISNFEVTRLWIVFSKFNQLYSTLPSN